MPTATEEWIEGPSDCKFFTKRWKPDAPVKAHVVFVHGFIEHITRYEHVFKRFSAAGIEVFGFDQRGFGQTAAATKTLGMTSWPKAIADIEFFVHREIDLAQGSKIFIFGHSMGGALAIAYATRKPVPASLTKISGIVSSAPLIRQAEDVRTNLIVVKIGSLLGAALPSLQLNVGVPSGDISRDPEVNKAYAADPYCAPVGTYKGVGDMLLGGQRLLDQGSKSFPKSLPILIYHGDADRVTDFEASRQLIEKLPATDKTFKPWKGYYHELHNEPGDEKWPPIDFAIDWIEKHSS